ncbi:MAG TPA: hypothetical protein VGF04_09765, partial [Solirubrobacterales bacterium]
PLGPCCSFFRVGLLLRPLPLLCPLGLPRVRRLGLVRVAIAQTSLLTWPGIQFVTPAFPQYPKANVS